MLGRFARWVLGVLDRAFAPRPDLEETWQEYLERQEAEMAGPNELERQEPETPEFGPEMDGVVAAIRGVLDHHTEHAFRTGAGVAAYQAHTILDGHEVVILVQPTSL